MKNELYIFVATVLIFLGGISAGVILQRMGNFADEMPILFIAGVFLAAGGLDMLIIRFFERPTSQKEKTNV